MSGGNVSRRALIRSAAWTAPVIAVAVATPLAAASEPAATAPPVADRLTFNTHRAWDANPWDPYLHANKPKIGVVVAAMDTKGPDAVGAVVLLVELIDAAGTVHPTQSTTKIIDRGWGATPDWTVWFEGNIARGQFQVRITATAVGVKTITLTETGRTVS